MKPSLVISYNNIPIQISTMNSHTVRPSAQNSVTT